MTMAYWDKGSKESRKSGIPASLTSKLIELDGEVRCGCIRGLLRMLKLDSPHVSIHKMIVVSTPLFVIVLVVRSIGTSLG